MAAADATLSAKQATSVNFSPSFHSVLEVMVMLGRAVWKTEVEGASLGETTKSTVCLHGQICLLIKKRSFARFVEHTASRECNASVFWPLKCWVIYHALCCDLPRQAGREE